MVRPDGGPFFAKNGLLFLSKEDVKKSVGGLQRAQPVLAIIGSDPSLRGVFDAFAYIPKGVMNHQGTFDKFKKPIQSMNTALENVLADKPAFFSWQNLLSNGEQPGGRQLRKFIQITPVLDFSDIQPGAAATDFIRQQAKDLKLDAAHGVDVRLTGQVPIADAEFSTVLDGFGLNGIIMIIAVILIVYAAVKSFKLVAAVFATVIAGLVITFAAGLLLVHQLNVLSIAFAVLFVGIGVDFGIQFTVRFKAERYDHDDFIDALHIGASKVGRPLALAAFATMAGFYSFLPTAYRGVADLGEIAGTGMLIAFTCAITILPALLAVIRPPPEAEPVGYKFLAPVDDFIERHRYVIVIGTLAVALAGTPLLRDLRFDFNPLNLDNQHTEAISTLISLMKDPETDTQTISVLEPNLTTADFMADKLRALPNVARVDDAVEPGADRSGRQAGDDRPGEQVGRTGPEPGRAARPAERRGRHSVDPAFGQDVRDRRRRHQGRRRRRRPPFRRARRQARRGQAGGPAKGGAGSGAALEDDARHLARLAPGLESDHRLDPGEPEEPLPVEDDRAGPRRGRAPKGNPNDNANMIKFAQEIEAVAPHASGTPVSIQEAGKTVKLAFIEAGAIAVSLIFIILWIVLRRVGDVLLTLVPLLLAGLVTLEITVLIKMPLNFANIIALPLLLGLGVAFKIYFVMAWRAGTKKLLQSSLTRAVFWSALTTATAFGSLWASKHPGTSSMGKLMALSLVCTLAAAILFQPALMGPPRKTEIR